MLHTCFFVYILLALQVKTKPVFYPYEPFIVIQLRELKLDFLAPCVSVKFQVWNTYYKR